MPSNSNEFKELSVDHNVIVSKIRDRIKKDKWEFILSDLPDQSVLVGGYIRDIVLNKENPNPDIDIVVPNNSLKVGQDLAKKFSGRYLILDQERNIVRIIFKKFVVDIASQTNKLLIDDLKKRDFTINSISFSFDSKELIDPTQGITDLKKSILRSFDNQNLLQDPLRILRCFRFVSEFNFTIEPTLLQSIEEYKFALKTVSVERIQYELKRIVSGKNALKAISYIFKLKIFEWIESCKTNSLEFLLLVNYEMFSEKEIQQYFPIFYLREMLPGSLIEYFKFSKSDANSINSLRRWSNKLKKNSIEKFTESERFQLHKELENILPAFILYLPHQYHDDWLSRWRNKKDKLFHPRNFINGDTLKNKVGIKDGPLLGSLLNYLSMEYAYERLNNNDEAIDKAKQWFQQNAPKCD